GQRAQFLAGEQTRALHLLAAEAYHQRGAAEIGVTADVTQGLNGHGGPGRVDRYATAVRMCDGHDVVYARESGQQFLANAADGVFDGWGHALDRGGDAEDVFGAGRTVGVRVAVEGDALDRLRRGWSCSGQGKGIERRRGRQIDHLLAYPGTRADVAIGVADDLAVAAHGLAVCERTQRYLV